MHYAPLHYYLQLQEGYEPKHSDFPPGFIHCAQELFIRVLASKTSEHMAASGRFQVAYSDVGAILFAVDLQWQRS